MQAVVERVIGEERADSWKSVVGFVMERLVEVECLGREVEKRRFRPDKVHWSAHEEAITPLAGKAKALRASLETFVALDADLHNRLVGEMRAGISAHQIQLHIDND